MFWSTTLELNTSSEWHFHDVFELIFCLDGQGALQVEGIWTDILPQRTILLPPGVRHRFRFSPGQAAKLRFICVPPTDAADYLSPIHLGALACLGPHGSVKDHDDNNLQFWSLMDNIPNGLETEDRGRLLLIWTIISMLLAEHMNDQAHLSNKNNDKYKKTMSQLRKWIDTNLDRAHNLDDLARRFGLSRSSLTREFKRSLGLSVGAYVRQRKLQHAGRLLSENHPICDVAYAVGYSGMAHFYRQFKQFYGVTPAEFRSQFALAAGLYTLHTRR